MVYHKDNKRPNIRPSVLRQIVPIYPNYIYNVTRVDQTYNQIMSMGYFKSANVIFNEQADSVVKDNYVTFVGEGKEAADSVHQTQEGYLQCDIHCIPALKQGYKIELEGSTTSSFYGLRATVGYQNRNIFRGAESFDVSFSVGYEYMKTPSASKRNAIEFGVNMGLQFPRFLLPFRMQRWQSIQMPRTRLEFGINFQDRPYYRRTLSSLTWGYSWSDLKYSSYSLRPIDINVIDMGYVNKEDFLDRLQNEYLKRSYESQFISGLSFSYVYNNQRKHLGGNATLLRFNYEMAGNLLDGLMHLFSRPAAGKDYYEVFGLQYSQYFRADLSVSRKIMLGEVTALVGRLYGGYGMAYGNSTSIPFDRLFYAGGANSMRGWAPRTLGPGSVPEPDDAVFPSQLGDMKLEANLELRFPIWGIFHGATFVDVGNIWFADRHSAPSPAAVSISTVSTNSWASMPVSACAWISSSPCCVWTGAYRSTTPMHLPDSAGSTISSGRIRRSISGWVIRFDADMGVWAGADGVPDFHCGGRGCVWSRCRARMIRLHGVRVGRGRIC